LVSVTVHVPSAAVVQDEDPEKVAPGASNETSRPATGVPPSVAVTVTVVAEPASACDVPPRESEGALGAGDGLADADALGDGDGLADADALGDGDGDADGDGLAEAVALGDGDALGSGEVDAVGDGVADSDADGEGDGLAVTDALGDGDGDSLGDGDGDSLGDGDGDGDGDSLGDGLGEGDSLGDGGGDGGSLGSGDGDGSSARIADWGAMMLSCLGAGAPLGDGAGVGVALGCGETVWTQNVPSADQYPARPLRSTPGTSSDIGGAVRAGAGAVLWTGAAVGVAVAVGAATFVTPLAGLGARQSSGCTIVSPVFASYSMIRTPDSRAHASRLSWSVGVSVTV
jgi:hypothetical protein